MFERYSFEDPKDDSRRVDVGVWGYAAAALAGSLYVLGKAGAAGFVAAVLPHFYISVVLVGTTAVTLLDLPGSLQLVVFLVAVPALLTVQALWMVAIILKAYRARGWIVHASI
jgi:hypothetical protein